MARVLFFLSVLLFALKRSVLWQKTHPALGSRWQCQLCLPASRQQQMLPINLAQCPSSESEVIPALPLSFSCFSLRCTRDSISLDISTPGSLKPRNPTRTSDKLKSSYSSGEWGFHMLLPWVITANQSSRGRKWMCKLELCVKAYSVLKDPFWKMLNLFSVRWYNARMTVLVTGFLSSRQNQDNTLKLWLNDTKT